MDCDFILKIQPHHAFRDLVETKDEGNGCHCGQRGLLRPCQESRRWGPDWDERQTAKAREKEKAPDCKGGRRREAHDC